MISVDSVLQYASDIPSAQRRGPPGQRPMISARTPSGRHPLDPKLSGLVVPQHGPSRTSKVSEKLVLIPDTDELDAEKDAFEEDDEAAPPSDEELERRKKATGLGQKSAAERLPKSKRSEKLSRVTAYCTAQAYKMRSAAEFLKTTHGARTKLYDDCLYVVFQMPLIPGHGGYRIRSSPVLKSPGGKSIVDEEIERNERREHDDYFFEVRDTFGIEPGHDGDGGGFARQNGANGLSPPGISRGEQSPQQIPHNALSFGEVFVFSYGVVVFWNFTERQEKDILADLTFSAQETGVSLVTRPQSEEDFETEEFHFEYNPDIPRARIFNDMITLRSSDHMIKLTMSHAISQSTKLSSFEEKMATTMEEAKYVPRRLALTGSLGLMREEVVMILGRIFESRVEVNLSSNVLDVPNFFWESEPTLHPLYHATRDYLEIQPRIQAMNEKSQVFLDLAEILSESIADKKMTRITWIIIILILISIFVTCSEVFLRFGLLSKGKQGLAPVVGNQTSIDAASLSAPRSTAFSRVDPKHISRSSLSAAWIAYAITKLLGFQVLF